ncbi:hypothetical protein ALCH109712_05075 [Alkalicoccus chagannorensis]
MPIFLTFRTNVLIVTEKPEDAKCGKPIDGIYPCVYMYVKAAPVFFAEHSADESAVSLDKNVYISIT